MKAKDQTQTRERHVDPPRSVHVHQESVERFKRRMLDWDNPVEYVNNMYGSHPDHSGSEYFETVFGRREIDDGP